MKHLKPYLEPQIGDYVYCEDSIAAAPQLLKFLEENYGRIVKPTKKALEHFDYDDYYMCVKYKVEDKLTLERFFSKYGGKGLRPFKRPEIIEFAPTLEELEAKIMSKKYNI